MNASKAVLETARVEIDQIAQRLEVPNGIAVEVIHTTIVALIPGAIGKAEYVV